MALPFFYRAEISPVLNSLSLDEASSAHVVQVLRMKKGEHLNLTDGIGNLYECEIKDADRKHCTVTVLKNTYHEISPAKRSIAVSLLKNTSRYEWFLEKATELGINEIIPLICERTEKEKFRHDRMQQICISAMLQSQQVWLPVLKMPVKFYPFVQGLSGSNGNYIAHCMGGNKSLLSASTLGSNLHALVCIGPEGDFTKDEVSYALQNKMIEVSLGNQRLRTETAAIVAAVLLTQTQS